MGKKSNIWVFILIGVGLYLLFGSGRRVFAERPNMNGLLPQPEPIYRIQPQPMPQILNGAPPVDEMVYCVPPFTFSREPVLVSKSLCDMWNKIRGKVF